MRKRYVFLDTLVLLLLLAACTTKDSRESYSTEHIYDVIIVGAGISGLSAGHFLQDYDILILEKEARVGGRAISASHDGFDYAKGTEYLGEPSDSLKTIIDDLAIEIIEIPVPMDAQFYDGSLHIGEEALTQLMISQSSEEDYNRFTQVVLDIYEKYEDVPEHDVDGDLALLDTFSALLWFERLDFPDIYVDKYNVMARGLFGANLSEISMLSIIPELGFDFEEIRGEESSMSYSVAGGITSITLSLADELADHLRLRSTVVDIVPDGSAFRVVYLDDQNELHDVRTQTVILAVPAPISQKIAGNVLKEEQNTLLEGIPYASYATVAFFTDEIVFDEAFDLAVPDGLIFTDVYDATWVQRHHDPKIRGKSGGVMSVFVAPHSFHDRSVLAMTDEELLKQIYIDLDGLFPDIERRVTGYDIQRFRYAYPVMIPGAYERLSRLQQLNNGPVLLAGDHMVYPTFEAAAESGYLAAKKIQELDI